MRRGVPSPAQLAGQGPKRACLEILHPKVENPIIHFRFNPTDLKIQKRNNFAESRVYGLQSPAIQWASGDGERLTLELMVDTSDTLEDVRKEFIDRLRELMRKNPDKHAPVILRLVWDRPVFTGGVENLDVTYVLFSPEGRPLRAKLGLTLLQNQTVAEMVKEEPTNSPDVEKTWVARRGDTLSGISAAVFEDPRLWREIARANGLADPRRLRPGTVLTVPRLR